MDYTPLYETITDALATQGYIFLEDVLSSQLCNALLHEAKKLPFKQAGISTASHQDTKRRRDVICWVDATTPTQQEYLEFCDGLQNYLNRHLFLGLRYYEAHFARYGVGDFYEKHRDSFIHGNNRKVTTVYYLNETWNKDDGGELVVYDSEAREVAKIPPYGNSMVVFLSEEFPHEVLPAKKERYSIAGWFRVDEKL